MSRAVPCNRANVLQPCSIHRRPVRCGPQFSSFAQATAAGAKRALLSGRGRSLRRLKLELELPRFRGQVRAWFQAGSVSTDADLSTGGVAPVSQVPTVGKSGSRDDGCMPMAS